MLIDICKYLEAPKNIDLECIGLKGNLYSMVVFNKKGNGDGKDYCFHPQAKDVRSAAVECLYDYFAHESNKDEMWAEMEKVLNED